MGIGEDGGDSLSEISCSTGQQSKKALPNYLAAFFVEIESGFLFSRIAGSFSRVAPSLKQCYKITN